ncbi:hypothetical protein MNBD_ALPHA08-2429 [hydrothermal vent metagenome]|uniref:Mannose-6-phosphate isomerase type II C-terminal domain-containing protein n=1 Tax=hydrothermal vent metagenome TaxID=652676 RepID=A0A3B0RXC3_9ZZZZ
MTNIVPRIGKPASTSAAFAALSNNDNGKSGFKDILADGSNYEIARLNIPARCNLPLRTDPHTSRHITVLSGIIHITLEDDVMVLIADESIYVPQGLLHGLENRADQTALIISVNYTA